MQFAQRHLAYVILLLSTGCAIGQDARPQLLEWNPNRRSATAITGRQRLEWVLKGTVGPQGLATGLFTAGIQTAENRPREYGPHWEGVGKRYGIYLSGVATERTMEAGLGALWGEDPRYFRAEDRAFGGRMKKVVVMTVAARREDGHLAPAYARLIAMPASNFLSNTWRADSISNNRDALGRTLYGMLGKLAGNAIVEFWPDIKKNVFHKH
jgi:hypothetical protein